MKKKYMKNYWMIWTLFSIQFIIVSFLVIFLLGINDTTKKAIGIIGALCFELLCLGVVTLPTLTKSITLTVSKIVIEFKKEQKEIPIAEFEKIEYIRPWLFPKRVYIFTSRKQYILLPWYIRNFNKMCKDLYKIIEDAHMESILDSSFKRKFNK